MKMPKFRIAVLVLIAAMIRAIRYRHEGLTELVRRACARAHSEWQFPKLTGVFLLFQLPRSQP